MNLKKVILLTKVFLKNSFSFGESNKADEKAKRRRNGNLILYAFSFIYLAAIMGVFSYNIISGLITINQPQIFLGLIFSAIAFFVIFQSIFTTMNVFYFSKDIEFILPLPIKPGELLAAKFFVILITEYIVAFIMGVLPLMIYGILTGAGPLYFIVVIILLFLFPILPLLLTSFLVMIIMSFAKITKDRDKFQLFATILMIVIIMGVSMFSSSMPQMTEEEMTQKLVQANGLVDLIGKYFITLPPTIQALSTSDIGSMLLALGEILVITAIAFTLFILVGQKLYLRGAIGNLAGGGKTRNKKIGEGDYRKNKLFKSYIQKEFKILIRNPIFFMQCIMPAILMPVLIIVISIAGIGNNISQEDMAEFSVIVSQLYQIGTVCLLLGIMQFFNMMSFTAITGVSRDGLNATFMKYIPVPYYKQFIYKMMPNVIMNSITNLIILGICWYVTKANLLFLLAIFALSILISMIISSLSLIVDLRKPKLQWDSEYAVVKQNMNFVYVMFYSLVAMGILFVMAIGLNLLNNLILSIIIMVAILGIILYVIFQYVHNHQEKLFEKIY